MTPLYLIECRIEQTSLLRFMSAQGLDQPRRPPDWGYGLHAWLQAAFGDRSPRPWRLLADDRRPPRLLGYSTSPAETMREHMEAFAEPGIQSVCPPDAIESKVMPEFRDGLRLGFELLCCPVGRKSRSGVEKDIFLLAADKQPVGNSLDRSKLYTQWAGDRLQRDNAAMIETMQLKGFRRQSRLRKTRPTEGKRSIRWIERPEAILTGVLSIGSPDAFTQLLARGIGRHRAFGYGMLLLKPPG